MLKTAPKSYQKAAWAERVLQAERAGERYPNVGAEWSGIGVSDAYAIQREYVQLRKAPIVGYKAALTAPAAQKALQTPAPIVGVLFCDHHYHSAASIASPRPLMLETELGFRIDTRIDRPVDADTVLQCIDGVLGMIELASIYLAAAPKGVDLIATNSAAFGLVEGKALPPDAIDIDAVTVQMYGPAGELHRAKAGDVMGGQRAALTWLINEVLALGYPLSPGHLLMTGSIGAVHPAHPGTYRTEFSALGEIVFDIL